MKREAETKRSLYKISKAYYEDGLTQQQIADKFGLSRIKISRLLQQARGEGIVQISISPPENSFADMERRMEDVFGLKEVVVVPEQKSYHELLPDLGEAAAEYLSRGLQGKEIITLSWGNTLLSVVNALPIQNFPELTVVQMLGGLSSPELEVHGAELVRRTAERLGGRPRMLSAPGIVQSKMVRDALIEDEQIVDTLNLASQADIALVGIGVLRPDAVLMQEGKILKKEEAERLKAKGAVGDIGLRFFDADGKAVQDEVNERIICLDFEEIRGIKRVIGVAGGERKYEAIRAVLRNRLVDVLVTDSGTAKKALQEAVGELDSIEKLEVEDG